MATDRISAIHSELEEIDGDLPESIDESALERMHIVAHTLDEGVRVPLTDFRVGIDPILGILPGAGDAAAAAVSLYIVAEAARMDVSQSTLLRMIANVGVDVIGGSVPVLGVLFDSIWKANKWNLRLALEDLADDGDELDTGPEVVTVD
ncbi:DUF4112 domain-containing protein [Natrinema marinum]|uniref:DUF4112 domain-containing protein n=1 Tax=Natrinema marinum TaxID=2961598 RepID=UPI0020C85B3B|nr:DUF4112 domain-containing protein [Natrinema marinum]